MRALFASVRAYRFFILSTIVNNFRGRFARSRFGALWGIFHPLAQVAVFFLILSHIIGARFAETDNHYGYAIYLCSGILGWQLFAELLPRCTTLFIDHANLIQKVSFPRITLLLIVAGEALLNNLLLLLAILALGLFVGHWPGWTLLWLPVLVLINLLLAMSLGMILGVLNVFIRDIGQFVMIALQFLFWLTPVVYMPSALPANLQQLLAFNPLFGLVAAYQQVFVFRQSPAPGELLPLALLACVLTLVFLVLYSRAQAEIADQL